jgi:hypothetical protein
VSEFSQIKISSITGLRLEYAIKTNRTKIWGCELNYYAIGCFNHHHQFIMQQVLLLNVQGSGRFKKK